jgi:hypothetical protein
VGGIWPASLVPASLVPGGVGGVGGVEPEALGDPRGSPMEPVQPEAAAAKTKHASVPLEQVLLVTRRRIEYRLSTYRAGPHCQWTMRRK